MNSDRFRLNDPDVTFEAFEGEILVINLASGNYYSLRGSAPLIWPWIVAGHSAEEVTGALVSAGAGTSETVAAAVADFVEKLRAENVLVSRTDAPAGAPEAPTAPLANFAPPSFECYRDMQDLLLLDPIHEVDVTGWPTRPPQSGQA